MLTRVLLALKAMTKANARIKEKNKRGQIKRAKSAGLNQNLARIFLVARECAAALLFRYCKKRNDRHLF